MAVSRRRARRGRSPHTVSHRVSMVIWVPPPRHNDRRHGLLLNILRRFSAWMPILITFVPAAIFEPYVKCLLRESEAAGAAVAAVQLGCAGSLPFPPLFFFPFRFFLLFFLFSILFLNLFFFLWFCLGVQICPKLTSP